MSKLLVADDEFLISSQNYNNYKKILFKSYSSNQKKNTISIYKLLDLNPNYYRRKLLKKIYLINNLVLKRKNLFLIEDFDFWECSVFREKITYGYNNPFLNLLKFIVLK